MSAIACEIIGTGDGEIKNLTKNEGTESKTIARDIVFEIIDNALDIVDDSCDDKIQKTMDQIPIKDYKEKHSDSGTGREKSGNPLIGTGDQKSNENLETREPVPYHPPVEKKNRLTDLVKNSKQILARIMMTDSKMVLQEDKKEEEEVVKVIELDCVQASDVPFKSRSKILPEAVPLPRNDSQDILTRPPPEEVMHDIGLGPSAKDEPAVTEKRRMTFPRAGGSRARAVFAAKCRTLKREANNLKKKKWDVGGKIVGFFRKKKATSKEEEGTKSKATQNQQDFENVTNN